MKTAPEDEQIYIIENLSQSRKINQIKSKHPTKHFKFRCINYCDQLLQKKPLGTYTYFFNFKLLIFLSNKSTPNFIYLNFLFCKQISQST